MNSKDRITVNDDGQTFDAWLKEVDQELESICGLGTIDLTDVDYWNMWDWCEPVHDAALEVLRENDYPMELAW